MITIINKVFFLIIVPGILANCNNYSRKAPDVNTARPTKFELLNDWPHFPEGFSLGQVTGIGIDTMQNIFLFHRSGRRWSDPFPETFIASNTISMLDRQTGKIINSWGSNLFIMPHGLTVDKNNNIWVTDVALQQVFKFNRDGELLMEIGEAKIAGNDSLHFNLPTDVAVAADGSFYVSDGYRNSRVVKFSSSGKYLFEWGQKGNNPGEFNIPHGIDLDKNGNVYVADRENNRIQVFDSNGKFLRPWKNKTSQQLFSLAFDKVTDQLFAIDFMIVNDTIKGSDIFQFNVDGSLLNQFGRSSSYGGPVCRYHDVAVDNQGAIYVADVLGDRIQKFKVVTGGNAQDTEPDVRGN